MGNEYSLNCPILDSYGYHYMSEYAGDEHKQICVTKCDLELCVVECRRLLVPNTVRPKLRYRECRMKNMPLELAGVRAYSNRGGRP